MARAMHVQAAGHAAPHQTCRLKVAIPPPMDGWATHVPLRVGGQDASTSGSLLGVEQEIVRLGHAAEERKRLQHVALQLQDDPAA
jgi:hypothetical protein